jgi:transposase
MWRVSDRKPYPSDLSDAQWDLIRPVITAWKAAHPSVSGHAGRYEMREIVNAIRYAARNGIPWTAMPHDLPPKSATYYYFATWRDDGTDEKIHDLLRWQVREKAGRAADPTATALDTQSLHAAVNVPAATTGKDAAKRVPGRKRGLAVDVIGLIIAVVVTAASVTDNVIGKAAGQGRRRGADGDQGVGGRRVQGRRRDPRRAARRRRGGRLPGRRRERVPAAALPLGS